MDMGVGVRVALGMRVRVEVGGRVEVGVDVRQRGECDAGVGWGECGWW